METILYPINALKIGGAEQQLLELVRGLDKRRFRPIVVSLNQGGSLDAEFAAVPGADVVHLNRRNKYDPTALFRMGWLLKSRHVSLVQPFLTPATFFGLLPSLVAGTPARIVTERCGVRRFRGIGYKAYRTTEDLLTKYADVVIANSEAGRALLLERGIAAEKIRVIYNGVNLDRLTPNHAMAAQHRRRLGATPDATVVGVLASLTPAKDHANFLRAAARLSQRLPTTRFAIIGDGSLRADLEALAAELGLSERVTFFGYQRQVADYLAACDLMVSSSRDNEGASNSILEAMALHRPVVATRVGGTSELIQNRDTGYLVPVGDPIALADAVEQAIRRPAEAAAIATRARHAIDQRFSLRAMVDQYEAVYDQLLGTATPLPAAVAHQA